MRRSCDDGLQLEVFAQDFGAALFTETALLNAAER
jgi:hypothetical protein